jgi:tail tube protein gp19
MTVQKKSYTSGHFELQIDGHASTAYLKSVEGGFVRASVIDEPIGTHNERIKHTSTVDVEPFTVDFGISGAKDVLLWIQGSWRKDWDRRNGQITHANFNLYETFEHEFYDALIQETTFPTLDGSAKEAAYIKCKIQPERVVTKKLPGSGARVDGVLSPKQKMWTPAAFRFNIDGIDDMKYTNKLESFTIKQGIKKLYTGVSRFPQIEPTNIQFPNLTGTISLQYADKLLQWHEDYINTGKHDPKAQKTGSIEFLAPDRKQTIFRINLYEVGLNFAAIESSTANAEQIKRVKFEMFVHRMELDGSGQLGFE